MPIIVLKKGEITHEITVKSFKGGFKSKTFSIIAPEMSPSEVADLIKKLLEQSSEKNHVKKA